MEVPATKTAFLEVLLEMWAQMQWKGRMFSALVTGLGNLHYILVWNQVPSVILGMSFSLSVGLLHVCEMASQICPLFLFSFGYLDWQPLSGKPGYGLMLAQHLAQLNFISCV